MIPEPGLPTAAAAPSIKPFFVRLSKFILTGVLIFFLVPAMSAQAREDIRIGLQLEPPVLDPTVTASATAGEIVYCNVLEGLTVLDRDGNPSPRLASAWEVSPDGLHYDFTLRKNVRFHDGRAFNSRVAAQSLNRIIDEDSYNPQRQWFARVSGVEALDPGRIRVHLSEPDAFLPFALALPAAVMVHPDSAAGNIDHPVGTGPFRFVSWNKERNLILERSDDYWGDLPILRRVEYIFMHTRPHVQTALTEGLVDVMLDAVEMSSRFIMRPDYKMVMRNLDSQVLMAMNNASHVLADIRVRRALSHAVNRKELLDIYGREVKPVPIGSHFSPSHPAYVDLTGRYPHDPEKARDLLSQAGVPAGTEISLIVPPTLYGRICGLEIANSLEDIGFKVIFEEYDWHSWLNEVFEKKQYDLTVIAHVEPMDLNIYARDDYYFNYDNSKFQSLWHNVLNARTQEELNGLLQAAQKLIAEDAVNAFLFMLPHKNVINRRVKGMWENTPIPSFVLEDLFWAEQ